MSTVAFGHASCTGVSTTYIAALQWRAITASAPAWLESRKGNCGSGGTAPPGVLGGPPGGRRRTLTNPVTAVLGGPLSYQWKHKVCQAARPRESTRRPPRGTRPTWTRRRRPHGRRRPGGRRVADTSGRSQNYGPADAHRARVGGERPRHEMKALRDGPPAVAAGFGVRRAEACRTRHGLRGRRYAVSSLDSWVAEAGRRLLTAGELVCKSILRSSARRASLWSLSVWSSEATSRRKPGARGYGLHGGGL